MIAPNGDSCAIFVLLVWFEFIDNIGVGDFFAAVDRDVTVSYDVEGVGVFDILLCYVWDFSNDLAEAAKLV